MTIPDFPARQWLTLILLWSVLAGSVGVFSSWPSVQVLAADETAIKVVIRYSGKTLGECRQLDDAELSRLPPNMRQIQVCPREKSPLYAELMINGEVRYQQTIIPSGLHNDGVVAAYEVLNARAGINRIHFRIRDDERSEAFSHELDEELTLRPDRIVTLHFADNGFRVTGHQ